MCDQTEIQYVDGDVVWVKLGSCWWPGEVVGPDKLPPDVLPSFRKPPIAVVKFFQEDSYEYVKNISCIYKYDCSRKNEFINKGLYMYRRKDGHMEKFPEDVIRAETAIGGDKEILTRDEFQEVKKESYAGIFGDKKTPASMRKGRGRGGPDSPQVTTPMRKPLKEKSDYKVHILVQKKEVPNSETPSTPSTSRTGSDAADDKTPKADTSTGPSTASVVASAPATTPASSSGTYACPTCPFSTSRLNVLILHNKTHSAGYTAYTPSPVPKKPVTKPKKTVSPKISKTPKAPRQRKAKPEKPQKKEKAHGKKRSADSKADNAIKKQKTDAEIKSSLLADWDDIDENSNDESSEMVVGTESPAVPTPEDLPSALVPSDIPSDIKSDEPSSTDKPESSSDSKYEFCEDEDWHVEADIGRKIPRMKNPKRKEGNKSLSLDEDEVAKEVADLLNKTTLPELPSIPEPLKVEENFPEPSIVKSPDKKPDQQPPETKFHDLISEAKPTKAIFKTKTFFRSRHSRSQDAIGKYIAEQLNAAERMDMVDSDLNGSEVVSFPETRESPPVEPVKVARLAPKIQLKKMKAEAAQLREKEKSLEQTAGKPELEQVSSNKFQDALWGTQEIKPINKDTPEKAFAKDSWREDRSFQNVEFPKRKLLGESSVNVNRAQETVGSPNVEESGNNLSNDLIETITNKYVQPDGNIDNLKATESMMEPLLGNTINNVTDKSTENYILPKTSAENPDIKSNVTTPKGSPMKLSSQNVAEECHKSPTDTIIDRNPINNKNDEQKSPFQSFGSNLQDNDIKSPSKIVIENSKQKPSENDARSPIKMVISDSPLKFIEDDTNTQIQKDVENSPQQGSQNDQESPIKTGVDEILAECTEDERSTKTTKRSPTTMVMEHSPHKPPKSSTGMMIDISVTEDYQISPIKMNIESSPQKPLVSSTEMLIDKSVPKCTKDNQKSPIKMNIESSPQKPLASTGMLIDKSVPKCTKDNQKSPIKMNIESSPQKPLASTEMLIDKSVPKCTEDNQKSPIKMIIESSPQKPLASSTGMLIDKSVLKCQQKSPTTMIIESSQQQISNNDETSPIRIVINSAPMDTERDQKSRRKITNTLSPKLSLGSTQPFSEAKELQHNTQTFSMEPYMSESTASAVDALLSVSREADRVPRIVGNDPPEDLFEDDHKGSPYNDDEVLNSNYVQGNDVHSSIGEQQQPMEINTTCDTNGVSEENMTSITLKTNDDTVLENLPSESENIPTESDLQIAEALINLPSTAMKNKTNELQENLVIPMNIDNHDIFSEEVISSEGVSVTDKQNELIKPNKVDTILTKNLEQKDTDQNIRFETEQEKSENFSAAQSLVQMSESIDHKINMIETKVLKKDVKATYIPKQNNRKSDNKSVEQQVASLSNENNSDIMDGKNHKFETTSSKLIKMLEEPVTLKPAPVKITPVKQATPIKQMIVTGKEKILNFDVANASKEKTQQVKQKIIIRRAGSNKGFLNNLNEAVASPDKIILSRSNIPTDGSSIQMFTIQGSSLQESQADDLKQVIIQPKVAKTPIHKPAKTPTKVQKFKPPNVIPQYSEAQATEQSADLFDINSMPVVLSEDILTPESIEKMPIVMSDGNVIPSTTANHPKIIKTNPTVTENEKIAITTIPKKTEMKTLIMSSSSEATKATTPNIISKSSKVRGGKPMLVIDKATGLQKIIITKPEPVLKELKQATSLIQHVPQTTAKAEKFIILPSANTPRPSGRTQKIVIDPQTGKAHMFIAKGQEAPLSVSENKPVSAKLIPSSSDASLSSTPTVMIITNAQGAQSRIVLTPEHEKMLFPNKQQPSGSQLKALTPRITSNPVVQKSVVSTNAGVMQKTIVTSMPVKSQTKAVNKQKGAIITSKGQLIVGGRVASTAQNIAPMPEVRQIVKPAPTIRPVTKPEMRQVTKLDTRPTLKRIVANEPKKLVQTIQKNSSEPLIFLQQKSGAVMQLTAAQFEHLQRTGQIVQKIVPPPEKKIVPPPEKKIVPPPEKKIVHQPEKKIVLPPEKKIVHQPEKKIVPPPEKKILPPPEKRIVVQKSITFPAKDPNTVPTQKQRARKHISTTNTPAKRAKQEISVAPAPVVQLPVQPQVPPLTSLSNTFAAPAPVAAQTATVNISSIIPNVITASPIVTSQSYSDLDNFEEMLPSTAIARPPETVPAPAPEPQPEPVMVQEPEPAVEAPPAQLAEGQQLLAVPGESVGGIPGAFYLCLEENGTFTPIDNRPLILENNQLVPIAVDSAPVYQQPERRDILEAALANSDVFHADTSDAPDFRDLNANVSVHCRVSETSTTLNQPIMTPLEMPSKGELEPTAVPSSLEDGLAVIGVTPLSVPTSLELPITVTDPRIAPKTTDPLSNNNYGTILVASPNTDMTYMSVAETGTSGGISMPLLTDDESVGKSMPILTDEVAVSSVESMESEEGVGWARRLLTPGSDTSETSTEIPLQPHIQISVTNISTNS